MKKESKGITKREGEQRNRKGKEEEERERGEAFSSVNLSTLALSPRRY